MNEPNKGLESIGSDAPKTQPCRWRGRSAPAPSGLRMTIRFLPSAPCRAIKRMQRPGAAASKLARPPAADPQPRYPYK